MKSSRLCLVGLVIAIGLVCFSSIEGVDARADSERKFIGSLTCTVADGRKFEYGRTRKLSCIFEPLGNNANRGYEGTISKYGLNIGAAEGKVVMVWSVFAADSKPLPIALSGTYTGVMTKGAIGGENGLIGGIGDRYTLIPIRTQANADVNFALAIAMIELRLVQPRAALESPE